MRQAYDYWQDQPGSLGIQREGDSTHAVTPAYDAERTQKDATAHAIANDHMRTYGLAGGASNATIVIHERAPNSPTTPTPTQEEDARTHRQHTETDVGGRFPHDPNVHELRTRKAAKLASTRDTQAQNRNRIDTEQTRRCRDDSLRRGPHAKDMTSGERRYHDPTMRPQSHA